MLSSPGWVVMYSANDVWNMDKVGLLFCGDLAAAERALYMITVGSGIAPSTKYDQIVEQRTRVFEHKWAWFVLGFSSYPYMVDRIVRLHEFARRLQTESLLNKTLPSIGSIPLHHYDLRSSKMSIS